MNQSPYSRGAEDGFLMGLYFILIFFGPILSSAIPMLSVVSLLMIVMVPLVVWRLMIRYSRREGYTATFPMLWMQGVMMFGCGMLIAGALLVVYMKWIVPDFVASQIAQLAAMADTAEEGSFLAKSAETARQMLDARFIPSATDIVVEFFLLAIVTGSVLSMTLAAVIAASNRRRLTSRPPR